MSAIHLSDHVLRARAQWLSRFQQKPKIQAWSDALVGQIQTVEDMAWEVAFLMLDIDNSTGVGLDHIGKIVNRGRNGLDDPGYRLAIKAEIRIHKTNGSLPSIISILLLCLGTGIIDRIARRPPASVDISVTSLAYPLTVFQNLARTKSGGTNLQLVYSELAASVCLTCSDVNALSSSATLGLGSTTETTGGGLTSVFATS